MDNIKQIRHRKQQAQKGFAMNTNKDEFLAPKDVQMAEEGVKELKDGIEAEDIYSINTSRNDMVLDDFGDGESWINNQIENALGSNHQNMETTLMTSYNTQADPTTFVETPEIRSIKATMSKDIEDYTTDLEMEAVKLQKGITKSKETFELVKKGIDSHEKDIQKATNTIKEQTPRFQT